jgi:hypothetical protein
LLKRNSTTSPFKLRTAPKAVVSPAIGVHERADELQKRGRFLVDHGYPWLWVLDQLGAEYLRALVAYMRQVEGNLIGGF